MINFKRNTEKKQFFLGQPIKESSFYGRDEDNTPYITDCYILGGQVLLKQYKKGEWRDIWVSTTSPRLPINFQQHLFARMMMHKEKLMTAI